MLNPEYGRAWIRESPGVDVDNGDDDDVDDGDDDDGDDDYNVDGVVNLLSKALLPSSYGLGVRGDMWHMTCATWHLTPDMWHLTHDMFHLTHRGWWTLCKNFKFLALTVWVWRCCEDSK